MILVEIYSKQDCHLCDRAKEILTNLQASHHFELREIIIHEGDEYFALYDQRVPVITMNGEFAFQFRVPAKEFIQRLSHLANKTP